MEDTHTVASGEQPVRHSLRWRVGLGPVCPTAFLGAGVGGGVWIAVGQWMSGRPIGGVRRVRGISSK